MKISINTNCLFGDAPLSESLASMRSLGYSVIEKWSVTDTQAGGLKALMDAYGVCMSAFCTDCFTLNDATFHDAYERDISNAIARAGRLGCPALITQVGQDTLQPQAMQHDTIVLGLKRVAPLLEKAGVTLLVEPLNTVKDHPGYYLSDSEEGFAIIRETGSPGIKLLYDIYHQLHMGEDVLRRIEDNLDLIGHFHAAGFPDRDDSLFTGFDYRKFFELIRQNHSQIPIGLELFPASKERAGSLLQALSVYL